MMNISRIKSLVLGDWSVLDRRYPELSYWDVLGEYEGLGRRVMSQIKNHPKEHQSDLQILRNPSKVEQWVRKTSEELAFYYHKPWHPLNWFKSKKKMERKLDLWTYVSVGEHLRPGMTKRSKPVIADGDDIFYRIFYFLLGKNKRSKPWSGYLSSEESSRVSNEIQEKRRAKLRKEEEERLQKRRALGLFDSNEELVKRCQEAIEFRIESERIAREAKRSADAATARRIEAERRAAASAARRREAERKADASAERRRVEELRANRADFMLLKQLRSHTDTVNRCEAEGRLTPAQVMQHRTNIYLRACVCGWGPAFFPLPPRERPERELGFSKYGAPGA